MVSRKQKNRMTEFITARLEDSRLYNIINQDHQGILTQEKPETRENPRKIYVAAHHGSRTVKKVKALQEAAKDKKVYLAHVLYKDADQLSFVRMVDRNPSWRSDKSLKKYRDQQINQMLHLRGIEKEVMRLHGDRLVYYQPHSAKLPEALVTFEMHTVILDYSHLDQNHPAYSYVKNGPSIDYKLPKLVNTIPAAARFGFRPYDSLFRAQIRPAEKPKLTSSLGTLVGQLCLF